MTAGADRFLKLPLRVLSRRDLTPTSKLVYAVVTDRMGEKRTAWPGVRRIARDLGTGKNATLRAVAKLEAAGLLVVVRSASGKVNTYRLPKSVPETGTVAAAKASPKRVQKRPRNGTTPKTGSVPKTGPGVPETGTLASPKRVQNQTDLITRASARGSGARTTKKIADEIAAYWNAQPKRPKVKSLSKGRRAKITARLKDTGFAESWREAIDRIEASSFCNGDGDRGWVAGFDWFVANDGNWLKTIEGKYDDRKPGASRPSRTGEQIADTAPQELPTIQDARERGWGADVDTHPSDWQAIAMAEDRGELPFKVAARSEAKTGAQFRKQTLQELSRATG